MTRDTTTRAIAVASLALGAACLIALADDAEKAAGPAMPDLPAIQAQVAELRGLEFKTDVPGERQTLEDFGAFVDAELDRTFPPERRKDMMDGLMRLGMIDEPVDLAGELRNAVLTQAGAHYDPKTKKFYYLMTDLPKEALDVVAAHELVHALQDQHHDLLATLEALEGAYAKLPRNDDGLLAVRGLIEGEATYIMTLWQTNAMGMDLTADPNMETMVFRQQAALSLDQIVAMTKMQAGAMLGADGDNDIAKAIKAMDEIPRYILEPLMAAYMRGAYFAQQLRQHGGWEAVDEAFDDLPQSSEQIVHPEKFTAALDRPTRLSMAEDLPGDGWTRIDAAIHGELFLELMLRLQGCPPSQAAQATAGWDGDIYTAWRGGGGRVIMALATTWDSETDAAEFFDAYRSILPGKYPGAKLPEPADDDSQRSSTRESYETGDGTLGSGLLARRGREVFAVEGGDEALNERILEALLAAEVDRVE